MVDVINDISSSFINFWLYGKILFSRLKTNYLRRELFWSNALYWFTKDRIDSDYDTNLTWGTSKGALFLAAAVSLFDSWWTT